MASIAKLWLTKRGNRVIGISIARLVLVIQGQWDPDMSWSYNPMLAVEVSEIGATLIALSVPGIKPIFDRWVLRKAPGSTAGSGQGIGNGSRSRSGKGSRGTALRTLSLRPTHSMLSSEYTIKGADDSYREPKDSHSTASTDGIVVRVDFNLSEDENVRKHKAGR